MEARRQAEEGVVTIKAMFFTTELTEKTFEI